MLGHDGNATYESRNATAKLAMSYAFQAPAVVLVLLSKSMHAT
jgi:hypothetical protein